MKRFHPAPPTEVDAKAQQATPIAPSDKFAKMVIRGSQSAVNLPVAAPLVAPKRATRIWDVEQLRELDPANTAPDKLASALLPHMEQPSPSVLMVVKHFIERSQGCKLTALKESLEHQAPGALMNFLFKQCPKFVREELLLHIQGEAPAQPVVRYILSDIDNTLCPSRDARYPKSTTSYPGRAAFWRALLGGTGDVSERTCFLSARFGEAVLPWAFISRHERRVTFANLARVGIINPKVLFGCVWDMPYPTLHGVNMSPLGAKKIKNFHMLRQVFPEYRYVFFGDTCEDDLRVGQVMLQTARKNVGAVFIHDFGEGGHRWSQSERHQAQAQGIVFYKTAPGAALVAYKRGLLSSGKQSLQNIAYEAEREFQAIAFETAEQKDAAQALLQADLDRIAQVLRRAA